MLDTPLMVRRRARGRWDAPPAVPFADWIARRGIARTWPPPTFGDLDYHLTTLFPPVRPRGHLEVRYLDAQPPGRWIDPVAMLAALLHRPDVTDRVLDLCAPVGTGEDRWVHAARHGTADPDLNRVARQLVDLACGELGALGLSGDSVDDITAALHARLDREPAPRRPGEPGRPTPPPRTPRVPPPPGPLPQPRTPQTGPRPRQSADPSTTRRTTP
ncbi:hypothetical protein BJF85_03505 [Saccharomonospora sp. CUA-673]|nr:hypothetical protein BJF85_03505 [Saccharomonospora sp. CUA-673]